MKKTTLWGYGLGVITVPVLVLIAVGAFNLAEIVGAPKQAPIAATPATLTAGARIYAINCAACHGLPGEAALPHAAQGFFFFNPPQFFHRFRPRAGSHPPSAADMASFAQRRAVGSYMTVRDGVPGTGMPWFRNSLDQTQIWEVALMLGEAQNLPPAARAALRPPGNAALQALPPASGPATAAPVSASAAPGAGQ